MPIPSWSVAPSGISRAICRPISVITASGGSCAISGSFRDTRTQASIRSASTNESPCVHGIWSFTSAITSRALSTAARTMSTETPRLTKPRASGGLTWISATSTRTRRLRMSSGISERNTGMKSARPSRIASRTFGPMKNAVCRNRPACSGCT